MQLSDGRANLTLEEAWQTYGPPELVQELSALTQQRSRFFKPYGIGDRLEHFYPEWRYPSCAR